MHRRCSPNSEKTKVLGHYVFDLTGGPSGRTITLLQTGTLNPPG